MSPQKTLEERARELEEKVEKSALVGCTIVADFLIVIGVYIAVAVLAYHLHDHNERLDRLEQSTRQTGKE